MGGPPHRPPAAVTPEFDGVAASVAVLDSREDHWSLEVEVTPETALSEAFGMGGARLRSLAWWASDDRGHRYSGAVGSSSGGGGRASGQVSFGQPLDPLATRLEIAAIADRHRALIRFPLEWA